MEVFFYGLFMDPTILSQNDIEPSNIRKDHLKDYTLKIGHRASLIPACGETCYGILMTCDPNELQRLYSEPSVADYLAEEVHVSTQNKMSIKGLCCNLPPELITATNAKYADSLYQLAKRYEFPEGYLIYIKSLGTAQH